MDKDATKDDVREDCIGRNKLRKERERGEACISATGLSDKGFEDSTIRASEMNKKKAA